MSAPRGCQPLPQTGRASLPLPTALPYQAMGPTELGPCPGPALACPRPQGGTRWPGLGLPRSPLAALLLAGVVGWAPAARACPDRPPWGAHSPRGALTASFHLTVFWKPWMVCCFNSFCKYPGFSKVLFFLRTAALKAQIITLSKGKQDWYETESSSVYWLVLELRYYYVTDIWSNGSGHLLDTRGSSCHFWLPSCYVRWLLAGTSLSCSLVPSPVTRRILFPCISFYPSKLSGCKMLNLWNKAGVY